LGFNDFIQCQQLSTEHFFLYFALQNFPRPHAAARLQQLGFHLFDEMLLAILVWWVLFAKESWRKINYRNFKSDTNFGLMLTKHDIPNDFELIHCLFVTFSRPIVLLQYLVGENCPVQLFEVTLYTVHAVVDDLFL
jgi:hypothetical protein